MDSEGQVYFDAGDKEIPDEDQTRYEAALKETWEPDESDIIRLLREYDREYAEQERQRDREPSPRQREHIEKRTRFEEALRREAQARFGTEGQEKE